MSPGPSIPFLNKIRAKNMQNNLNRNFKYFKLTICIKRQIRTLPKSYFYIQWKYDLLCSLFFHFDFIRIFAGRKSLNFVTNCSPCAEEHKYLSVITQNRFCYELCSLFTANWVIFLVNRIVTLLFYGDCSLW